MKAVGIIFANVHDNLVPELAKIRTIGSIPFGGRYRLIDFPLSNMVNSGINTVGIITKSNYQSLMDHVGSGKDWDLARKDGGVIMLPPYGDAEIESVYGSRLDALKGAINFIKRADEEYVVLTDCDSVCRMDYSKIIDEHIAKKADVTIVYKKMLGTDLGDASIPEFKLDKNGRITDVSYKVGQTDKELNVCMNIFIMKRSVLLNFVLEAISKNLKHFVGQILANNLANLKVFGHEHKGYYTCINSLQSYYNCSMDLLKAGIRHELFGDRSVFTKVRDSAPTKYGNTAIVKNSLIADGCQIEGQVENSILFRNVKVARGCVIKNSIVMQNTILGEKSSLNCIIADKDVVIKDKVVLAGTKNHPFYLSKGIKV